MIEERILITDLKGKFPSEIADEIVKKLEEKGCAPFYQRQECSPAPIQYPYNVDSGSVLTPSSQKNKKK